MRRTRLAGMCVIVWWVFCAGYAAAQVSKSAEKAEDVASVSQEIESDEQVPPAYSLRSPRATLQKFVSAMEAKDYRQAITALDLSELTPPPDAFQKIELAQHLKFCLDRVALVDPELISDAPDGTAETFPPDDEDAVICIVKCEDDQWRFSPGTLDDLPALYDLLQDKPPIGSEIVLESTEDVAAVPDAEKQASDEEEEDVPAPVVPSVPDHLSSARRVMRTLFVSLEEKDYPAVVSTLDFSELERDGNDLGPYAELEQARRLQAVIQRMADFDYGEISDDPDGPAFLFPIDAEKQPIAITRGASGVWRFSAETVVKIDSLYDIYGDRPVLFLTGEQRPWYRRELFMGQQVWQVLALFGAIFFSLVIGQIVRSAARWRAAALHKRERLLRALTLETIAKTFPAVAFVLGLAGGINSLTLAFHVDLFTGTMLRIIVTLIVGYICYRLVDVVVGFLRDLARRSGSTLNDMLVPIVSTSLRLTVIVLVLLEIATAVSDQPPSAVIAGLGAGGLAIGLAAQDTIKNFFGSVMIFADRPFELGDRIVIDGHDGPVESVGFRSTRIRTLDGHLVTVPNGEMAYKTIHNIGKRPYIRRVMDIRIAYGTPPEQIQLALEIVRNLLDQHEGRQESRPPRVFLHAFLESVVSLRAIYWYHPPDYWEFCAFGERLNLQIMQRFRDAGIEFALPAQKLYVQGLTDETSAGT